MATEREHVSVLAAYPEDCRPTEIEPLGSAGGFSGARFWRLVSRAGLLCLRRWPPEHPSPEGLEFIQAVLWQVVREGFDLVPLPLCTRVRKGYVQHGGHLWELAPWMPGRANFRQDPSDEKLTAAMTALAEFHLAAAAFPLPDPPFSPSPGIADRLERLHAWVSGDLTRLAAAVNRGLWPELEGRAARIFDLFPIASDKVRALLQTCAEYRVPLQPCIRDIWHKHVLFEGNRVTGLIDFGSMGPENVAADVARLLGSMAGDDSRRWQTGLDAYRPIRPLSDREVSLVYAFDQSTVLMAGLNWIDWICRQRRTFEDRAPILARLDEIIGRMEHQALE